MSDEYDQERGDETPYWPEPFSAAWRERMLKAHLQLQESQKAIQRMQQEIDSLPRLEK